MTLQAAQFATDPLWHPTWKESYGEATIQERSQNTSTGPTLYCGWFCPFAQRAWVALEELGLDYKYVEINPYKVDPNKPGGYSKEKQTIQEKKKILPDFVAIAPYGLVPALVEEDGTTICDSSVCLHYLDKKYGGGKLFPEDPLADGLVRLVMDHVSGLMGAYFTVMTNPCEQSRIEKYHSLVDECRALAMCMTPWNDIDVKPVDHPSVDLQSLRKMAAQVHEKATPGPFVLGESFSVADIALGTVWIRIVWALAHYRDVKFPHEPAFERLNVWWQAVSSRPSFQKTLVCKERLMACDLDYAKLGAQNDSGIAALDYTKSQYPELASKKKAKVDVESSL